MRAIDELARRSGPVARRSIMLLLTLTTGAAHARVVAYAAKAGDTCESIAAEFYGNRSLAALLAEANGVARDAHFKNGQRVRIPTAYAYRLRRGDTLEGLSGRLLDDKRRANVLATLNGLKLADKLREGQELTIPFQHVHVADAPESLSSVARTFYGDGGRGKMIAEYNFRASPMLGKGERVIVPIAHVRIRTARLRETPPTKKEPARLAFEPASTKEAQRREEAIATRVGNALAAAEHAYQEGNYADVPAMLDKVLAQEEPSEAQLAELFRLKACAYVALGMDELAEKAFREVVARRPDISLDESLVSPKIRAALDRARKPEKGER